MIEMRKKRLNEYKAVVFDLDGTLYYQKPFRIRMAQFLLWHLLTHPKSIKDMFIIMKYRKVREKWEHYEKDMSFEQALDMDGRQYQYVAIKQKTTSKHVQEVIQFYMLEMPLNLLKQYRDETLAYIIEELQKQKRKIIIYSDYPVQDKLHALQMCFSSADEAINCMKPDPKGLQVILERLGMSPEDVIMIGDRYEKDGLAAIANKMDYIILSSKRQKREKQEKELL